MFDKSSVMSLGVVVSRLDEARSLDGRTVAFADGVRALVASSGLWHQNIGPATFRGSGQRGSGQRGSGRRIEPDLARQLFADDVRGRFVFTRDAVSVDRLLRTVVADMLAQLVEPESSPLIGMLTPSSVGPATVRTMPIHDVGQRRVLSDSDHPDRTGYGNTHRSRPQLLAVAILSSATGFGQNRLTADEANRFLDKFATPATLVVADERVSGFFRTGPAFGFERWNRRPDIVVLGPGLVNGLSTVHALAGFAPWDRLLPTGYEPSSPETREIANVAETMRRLRTDPSPLQRSVELLDEAVGTLVDSRLAVRVSGGGWVYAITPAVPDWTDPARLQALLEAIRLEELWMAATRDGDLLLSPFVDGNPADIARIVDSLHTGVCRLIHR